MLFLGLISGKKKKIQGNEPKPKKNPGSLTSTQFQASKSVNSMLCSGVLRLCRMPAEPASCPPRVSALGTTWPIWATAQADHQPWGVVNWVLGNLDFFRFWPISLEI